MKTIEEITNNVFCGDCLEVMAEFPDNCIDSIVTDPPYFLTNKSGSGFMNKEWDSIKINKSLEIICKSKEFARFVANSLQFLIVDSNMVEANIAQKNANIKQEELHQKKNQYLYVPTAAKSLKDPHVKSKANINSVQGVVLTKDVALDLLNELSESHITKKEFNQYSENVLFVVPISYLQNALKNIVPASALKLPIKLTCEEKRMALSNKNNPNLLKKGYYKIT